MEHFDRPWPSRRGIETVDYNNGIVLARTTVEHFASDIALHATRWERDVLGATVVVGSDYGWVFRLKGHAWATLVPDHSRNWLQGADGVAAASARLGVPVILYSCSDTCGSMGYFGAEGGRIVDSLQLFDGKVKFSSRRRKLKVTKSNAYRVAEEFFLQHDAYEPGIFPEYFFANGHSFPRVTPGEKREVRNMGFTLARRPRNIVTIPIFERVDYLVFERTGPSRGQP